jgi:hypothetical protein
MQRPLLIFVILVSVLAYQTDYCHSEVTNYTRSWSSSVTTRTYSTSTSRRVTPSHSPNNRSSYSAPCPIRSSADDSVTRKVGNGANDNNCVLFLRQQRGINLPDKNLTTYASKLSIINSHFPRENNVAIIKTPGSNARIGHLAEVTDLEQNNGKVTMRLTEANNPKRGYYERTITGENLEEIQKKANIVGYYVEPDGATQDQRISGSHNF